MTELRKVADSLINTANLLKSIAAEQAESKPTKEYLNFEETAEYLGIKKSSLYRLTAKKALPFYKPTGGLIFFSIADLKEYMNSKRVKTESETETLAANLLLKGGNV